jgi:hypothetical protein
MAKQRKIDLGDELLHVRRQQLLDAVDGRTFNKPETSMSDIVT